MAVPGVTWKHHLTKELMKTNLIPAKHILSSVYGIGT